MIAGMGAVSGCQTVTGVKEVPQTLHAITDSLEVLEHKISELAMGILPILHAPPPEEMPQPATATADAKYQCRSELGQCLDERERHIRALICLVERLIERLEV